MKIYLFATVLSINSIVCAMTTPITYKPFKKHFEHCTNHEQIGGCPECKLLFMEKLQWQFQQFRQQFSEPSSYEQLIKKSCQTNKKNDDFRALNYRAACLRPHRDGIEDTCPIMTINRHCPTISNDKIDLKLVAGSHDICALYMLGFWYRDHNKENLAELVWNIAGQQHPESYVRIGRMFGNWLTSKNLLNTKKACAYFECAGDAGYVPGYLESALVLRTFLTRTYSGEGHRRASEILQLYNKAIERQKKGDVDTTPNAYEEKADFILKFPSYFNDQLFIEAHEEAITRAKSAKAAYEYAQLFEKKGFYLKAIQYFEQAINLADPSEKFIAKKSREGASGLYLKSGSPQKAKEILSAS